MKNSKYFFAVLFIFFFATVRAQLPAESRMMTDPTVSSGCIAFVYANDLWKAGLDGSNVTRLTSNEGAEFAPTFSPDGKTLAFTGQYDGNLDVFTMPAEGGVPTRMTWHPSGDYVRGFTPDGKSILFSSDRESYTYALPNFYLIPVTGGFPEKMKLPGAVYGSFSPDARRIAYSPYYPAFQQWKNYRGGRISFIWVCDLKTLAVEKIPQPSGGCNDWRPMWIGDFVYFLSDRNGEFNLFSYNTKTKDIKQLTRFTDFPINTAGYGGGRIIFEQSGYLHLFDPGTGNATQLHIRVPADLPGIRPRYVPASKTIRNADLSPSGARAVFEARGEIITVPAEKGDARNLTNSPGVCERMPAWSPDGKKIAWLSDESGEYQLVISDQEGKGDTKNYALNGAGFYYNLSWSPDSKMIGYTDNAFNLYFIDLSSSKITKIATEPVYDIFGALFPNWSPDSKWITYAMVTPTNIEQVWIYSLEKDKSFPVTDGLSDCSGPVFDKAGKYLYFFGSTDAGPVRQWFDLSSEDMHMKNNIYLAVLDKTAPNPLLKESDEEKGKEDPKKDAGSGKDKKEDKDKANGKDKSKGDTTDKAKTIIDVEGISDRILALPVGQGVYSGLQAGPDKQIYYQENPAIPQSDGNMNGKLHSFNFETRKDNVILDALNGYALSADKSKILYALNDNWFLTKTGDKIEAGKGALNLDAVQLRIDPPAEWRQMFNDIWRINRDYFYDPGMQGADWNNIKKKYEQFLPSLSCRDDFTRLTRWMCSELSIGHSYTFGGEQYRTAKSVPVGLLGADYTIDNDRFRFSKIYGGLNWTPELRSPLTEPGVNVKEGEYLLAVNGKELKAPVSVYSLFENCAGKLTEIRVGPHADTTGSRVVQVVPIESEYDLRNRYWVENNLRKVTEATNGKVAYVYVPNTATAGHDYFKRYFFPQSDREAIIIDERFNGGGSLADYITDILRRPHLNYWATRYGQDIKTPNAAIQGPKVMLINEYAGSGGDYLPWTFRKLNLGKLIGKRTWGGLVGILNFPGLMDGGFITAPNVAFWSEEGWRIENEGIAPDIEVEQMPAEVAAGKDPQLDKAIQVVLEELKNNPVSKPSRPAYPVRVRK
ncbi:MAG: PDZ domain-containing protein [Bacteroidetes bacterium]|nr:PDZ domain-containing protein [Bacteroidota bacterium]